MIKKALFGMALLLALPLAAGAQDPAATPEASMMMEGTPSVTVSDQTITNGAVTIESAYSAGAGFVVIHIDNDGAPGPVAGQRSINNGTSNVK
jgi:hypothetical protein